MKTSIMAKPFSFFLLMLFLVSCSSDSDNEATPTITVSNLTLSIPENPNTGDIIGTINASSSSGSLQFSIQSQTPEGAVSIDNAGTLKVADANAFDYETNPTVSGTVQVSQGLVSQTATFQINLEDVSEGNVYPGSIHLETQEEINLFGENHYTEIMGYLWVNEDIQGDIVDLTPLQDLQKVGQSVFIKSNDALTSLEGLNNLQFIAHDFEINYNSNLTDISALSSLQEVGVLEMRASYGLTNLNGLEQLEQVGTIILDNCSNITNIDALSGLQEVTEGLALVDMNGLASLEAFSNVQFPIEWLNITRMPLLHTLDGLENIQGNLEGFIIAANPLLTDLSALAGITGIVNFSIIENNALTSINGLSGLETLSDLNIIIHNNPLLNDISPFCNVTFNNLQILSIKNNPQLLDLSCFSGLTAIHDFFQFENQENTSLDGFQSLETVGSIMIRYNDNLIDYCALSPLFENPEFTDFDTTQNAYNPSVTDMQNGDCSL